MGESKKLLKPLGSFVLVRNPLHGKLEAMEDALEKMPEKDRMEYLKENMYDVWQDLEILGVGPRVETLTVGDHVATEPELAKRGIVVMGGEYLMIRESDFVGLW